MPSAIGTILPAVLDDGDHLQLGVVGIAGLDDGGYLQLGVDGGVGLDLGDEDGDLGWSWCGCKS